MLIGVYYIAPIYTVMSDAGISVAEDLGVNASGPVVATRNIFTLSDMQSHFRTVAIAFGLIASLALYFHYYRLKHPPRRRINTVVHNVHK